MTISTTTSTKKAYSKATANGLVTETAVTTITVTTKATYPAAASIPAPLPQPSPEPTPIPAPTPIFGRTFLIEPIGGSGQYPDVWAAINAGATGGDAILLKDGNHGHLEIKTDLFKFDKELIIRAVNPLKARITSAMVSYGAKNVAFEDLDVYPDAVATNGTLLYVQANASHIKFRRNNIRSAKDVSSFLTWTAQQWLSIAKGAIVMLPAYCEAIGNHCNVVGFGIGGGDHSKVIDNFVTNHCADGIRAGAYSLVQGNWQENAFQVDGNHCDGFQAFAGPSGVLVDLHVIDNDWGEWSHPQLDHPLRASMQGIGCYDGWYDGMIVRNNRVKTRHWHGISLYGARNCIIEDNTVVDLNKTDQPKPWIAIFDHKNGTAGSGNIVRNNLAPQFGSKSGVVVDSGNRTN